MTGWQCVACDTYNGVNDAACHVCNGARRVAENPPPPPPPPPPPAWPPSAPAQPWIPPMDPPPFSRPFDSRSRSRRRALTAVLSVALAGGGVVAGMQLTGRANGVDSATPTSTPPVATTNANTFVPPDPTVPEPTASSQPPPPPVVGVVDISEVVSSPDATAVATTLDTYFSGVNAKDFTKATSVFDPAGILDPGSPAQVDKLAHDDQTSNVSDVAVHNIVADTSGRGAVKATATFQSTQSAGFGPRSRPSETCTRWAVTYTMSGSAAAGYRILRGDGSNRPC